MTDNERRRYYRIKDKVSLRYRILNDDEYETEVHDAAVGFIKQNDLRHASHCIDARLEAIIRNLESDNPLVAEALSLINKQFSILKVLTGESTEWNENDDYENAVSLSGGGMAFYSDSQLLIQTPLKMEITLYPSTHFMPVLGRVVSCRENLDDSGLGKYVVAVDFEGISEDDREEIVSHVVKKQATELKHKRLNDAAA